MLKIDGNVLSGKQFCQEQGVVYNLGSKLAIYAEGEFFKGHSKTGEGVIRYGQNPIVCVIDSTQAGKTVGQVMGINSTIPIVSSLAEALKLQPDALLLGTAWTGGRLPDRYRKDIADAIVAGLDVINGLHDFLSDDKEFSALASKHNVNLLDVRKAPDNLPVASGLAKDVNAFTVLTVGSDISIGKMTVSLELAKSFKEHGLSANFVATGQTGIMIVGKGIAIDRVIGDFMAGATEQMVVEAAESADFVFVEGQGSLVHPGFSGVTLAILHGACPHALILCHKSTRLKRGQTEFAVPSLSELVKINEDMAAHLRPAKVVGIALNTQGLTEAEAKKAIVEAEKETGLPANDAVRFGCENLLQAIVTYKESQR
jgi:uncharacterized NAD-dependent epimerase/dehydratase family protein